LTQARCPSCCSTNSVKALKALGGQSDGHIQAFKCGSTRKGTEGVYIFDLDKIQNLSAQYDLTTLPGNLGGLTPTIDAA